MAEGRFYTGGPTRRGGKFVELKAKKFSEGEVSRQKGKGRGPVSVEIRRKGKRIERKSV